MRLSKEKREELVEKYKISTCGCSTLAREFGVDRTSAWSLLKRRGIKIRSHAETNRKYTLNQEFLDVIDTEEKAYFLGFFYADGSNKVKPGVVDISLQERDIAILEKFKEMFDSGGKITIRKAANERCQRMASFIIHSRKLSNRLVELGCPNNKTFTLVFPTQEQVPRHLWNHFLRGYIDGDGCVRYCKTTEGHDAFNVSLVGTELFCSSLKSFIKTELDVHLCMGKRHKNRDTTTRYLCTGGRLQVSRLLNWLYKDATIYLERKYQKYQEILKIGEQIESRRR